ncbi:MULTISPECIES: hypothetical protein [Actinosynnema]|uniref:hypothetical protein n=1 Tax=Actinosynnema TaxID=40566 RepID=UPI0020A53E01|nr:hypothetical protein [Actinosynnema pretiosum]
MAWLERALAALEQDCDPAPRVLGQVLTDLGRPHTLLGDATTAATAFVRAHGPVRMWDGPLERVRLLQAQAGLAAPRQPGVACWNGPRSHWPQPGRSTEPASTEARPPGPELLDERWATATATAMRCRDTGGARHPGLPCPSPSVDRKSTT